MSEDRPITRTGLFNAYIANMSAYLHLRYPHVSEDIIVKFIEKYIDDKCNDCISFTRGLLHSGYDVRDKTEVNSQPLWPTCEVIHYPTYGNIEENETYDLFRLVQESKDKIISPFGTVYETVDKKSSFLKGMIDVKGKARKSEKKLMLAAKKSGDKKAEIFHNNNQATIKITMNSLIGAMGSGFNFLSSIADFNSVTSISRFFIMNAYAHAERFLEGNFYFRNEEQVINFIITCMKYGPDSNTVESMVRKYDFYIPSSKDVYTFLTDSLHRYITPCEHPKLLDMLDKLSTGTLCFIWYMSNGIHLIQGNNNYWKRWMYDFFRDGEIDLNQEADPMDLYKLDGDLVIVMSTVYNKRIPVNDKGNSISVYDCIEKYPDLARQFVLIGRYMQSKIDEIYPIFELFTNHSVGIGYISEHKYMFRDTVILSDTDSIIFTTKSWIKWYIGEMKMTDMAFNMNALIVYFLSKANAFILYNVSKAFGAVGKDLKTMNMKNEFMMPIMILTSLKKHYASILKIQEGVYYNTPRLDIKGVGLRGSNFGIQTLKYTEWFIRSIIDEIYNKGNIDIRLKIQEVLQFERLVYDSLIRGETTFLPIDPIKSEDEYADSERTLYFNYLFYEAVFSEKYGSIPIPTKCYVLPLIGVTGIKYTSWLEQHHPDILAKIQKFRAEHEDKDINRIPINPLVDKIPSELNKVINYKSIVYTNARPLYLILQSFGVGVGNGRKFILLSDMYGWVSEKDAANSLVHLS